MTIKGKVADVVDEYKVVTNIGSDDGVKRSHRYVIYTESDPIEDPDTGEELGKIEYELAEVRPIEIDENKSIMKTDEKVGGFTVAIPDFKPSPKKLTSNPEFKHGDDNVSVGDKIKFLTDLDDEDDQ